MDPALGQSSSDKSYSPGPGSIMTSSSRDTTPDHSSEGPIRKPGAGVDVVDPSLTLASAVRGPMANHEGGRSEMERALNPTSNPFVVGAVQRRSKPATPSDRHAVQSREKQPHQPQPMQRLHSASTNPNSGGGGGPGEGAGGVIGGSSRNSITGPPRYFDSPSWHPGLVGSTTPTTTAKTVTTTPTNLLSGCFPPPSPQVTSGGGAHYMAMRMDARPEPPGLLGAGGGNLENFYAYCFDRGNGNYARLIPADMLPPLAGIPAFQQGSEGMIVLPLPQGLPPRGPMSNIQPVMLKTPPASPKPVSDMIQKKIDHIVATSPAQPKRPKVYCDKWVHEGVCAFTQQGCKYKHEMPMDKATQNSLGLFHGLPAWWKKHQAELQRQQDSEETVTITGVDYGIASSANNASAGTMVGGFQMLGIGAGNVPVNGVGGRDRALTSPATTIPQSTLSQPPGQGWRPNDGTFKHTSMPYRSSPGTVPPGNAGQAQMATFRSNVATVPRLSDPRLPLRHRESLPPLPPSCMWGPIGPPSKFPGLSHGDTAADAGPGTARWGLNRTGPAMMPHGPQPPPGFVGFSGAEGNDVSTQGPTGLAVLNPRSGK